MYLWNVCSSTSARHRDCPPLFAVGILSVTSEKDCPGHRLGGRTDWDRNEIGRRTRFFLVRGFTETDPLAPRARLGSIEQVATCYVHNRGRYELRQDDVPRTSATDLLRWVHGFVPSLVRIFWPRSFERSRGYTRLRTASAANHVECLKMASGNAASIRFAKFRTRLEKCRVCRVWQESVVRRRKNYVLSRCRISSAIGRFSSEVS